jgi:hypothetical protein
MQDEVILDSITYVPHSVWVYFKARIEQELSLERLTYSGSAQVYREGRYAVIFRVLSPAWNLRRYWY